MKKPILKAGVAIIAAASLSLVGCTAGSSTDNSEDTLASTYEELVERAKEEGTLTIYSSDTEEHLLTVIEGFEAKYGIKVEYIRVASTVAEQRFTEEVRAGIVVADVVQQADPTFFNLYSDLFRPLSSVPLQSPEAYDQQYVSDYSIAGVIFPSGLQYNTDLVSPDEVPTSYEDLLDPKWKGKILFIDPTASPTPLSLLDVIAQTYGDEWIKKFGEQDLQYVNSAGPGAAQVAAGAFAINFPTAGGAQTAPVKAGGAPIDWVLFDPIQFGTNELSLPKNSPHPNAGALFLDYRTSLEGWTRLCALNPEYATPFETSPAGCIDSSAWNNPIRVQYQSVFHNVDRTNEILDLLGY